MILGPRCHLLWASIARGRRLFWKPCPSANKESLLLVIAFSTSFEYCSAGYSQQSWRWQNIFTIIPLYTCDCREMLLPTWRNPVRKNRDATVSLAITPFFLNGVVWPERRRGKQLDGERWYAVCMVCVAVAADHICRGSASAAGTLKTVLNCLVASEASMHWACYFQYLDLENVCWCRWFFLRCVSSQCAFLSPFHLIMASENG